MSNQLASLKTLLEPLFPGLMGIELLEAGPERVSARMLVREDLCTTGRILHGGAAMAFADTLGGIGAYLKLGPGERTTTIESSTKFVGAAAAGTHVTGECTSLHSGRTTTVWQTMIRLESGRLCAVVTQTQLVLAAKP